MIKTRILLEEQELEAVKQYLAGILSARALGLRLEMSHQQAINFVSSLMRQWYQEQRLVIRDET